jgi:hypothetical protein
MKRAKLITDTVVVMCPHCNNPQPNKENGSHQWMQEDFTTIAEVRKCCDCGKEYEIKYQDKVSF